MADSRESRGDRAGSSGGAGRIVSEAVLLTAVMAVLAGLAWWWSAPNVFAEATENGARVSTAEARRQFGIEAWFAVVTAIAGAVCGALLMYRHRFEPVTTQVTLAASGVAGALVAWQLGRYVGPGDLAERADDVAPGALLELPLDVVSYAAFSFWPIAAVIAGAVVIAVADRPDESRGT